MAGLPNAVANCYIRREGFHYYMVEELEQEYSALRDKVHDLQEYL
jgi:hypothetical protein